MRSSRILSSNLDKLRVISFFMAVIGGLAIKAVQPRDSVRLILHRHVTGAQTYRVKVL